MTWRRIHPWKTEFSPLWIFPWLLWAVVVANLPKTVSGRKSLKRYCKLRILTIQGFFSSWKRKKLIKNILRALHRFPHVENALQRWYCWNQGGGLFTMDRFVWKIKQKYFLLKHCHHYRGYLIFETWEIDQRYFGRATKVPGWRKCAAKMTILTGS